MSRSMSEEQLIRSYFLGDLPESEEDRIQERAFTDPEFYETLLMIEGELVDGYALDLISEQERAKLERGFLVSPHQYQKVRVVRTLKQYVSNTKPSATRIAKADAWGRPLKEAHANRELILSLTEDGWLGARMLALLKSNPLATTSYLYSNLEDDRTKLDLILARLVECGLVEQLDGRYSCSWFGSEMLEKIKTISNSQ